jgi:hypothetical protein
MSSIAVTASATGAGVITLAAPVTNTNRTITLPDATGTVAMQGGAGVGKVLQVVSTHYTTAFSSTSATPVDVSGFSALITPTSATSKILVFVSVTFGFAQDTYPYILLKRNGVSIGTGTSASGNQINTFLTGTGTNEATSLYKLKTLAKSFLDTPTTTSLLTYQIQFANPYIAVSNIGYINRQSDAANTTYIHFPSSSITIMEIAA